MRYKIITTRKILYALLVIMIFSISSCKGTKHATTKTSKNVPPKEEVAVNTQPPVVTEPEMKMEEEKKEEQVYNGSATYYADKYHGQSTASGELYDKNGYTCAVRRNTLPLPFGTMVEVYSVKRDKKVIVKVNDTMGNNSAAIIDLSYKAAEEIGLNIDGRTDVTVRVITAEEK